MAKKNKNNSDSFEWGLSTLIIIGVFGLILTIYLSYQASNSHVTIFSYSILALFSGILYESYRITENWKVVFKHFIGTYFCSFISFLPGKNERSYDFDEHLSSWPYFFLFLFALGLVIFNKDKVTARLTEGMTLLASISLIYWIFDYDYLNNFNWFKISVLFITSILVLFSLLNALTNINLTKGARLVLSIWTTIIFLTFGLDNVIRTFKNEEIENSIYLADGLYIGLQFFLLGVCSLYIMQNYIMLASFLPNKNGNYKNDLKVITNDHVSRYSDKQVFVGHSLLCIIYSIGLYTLNYKYQVLPRQTVIWFVIVSFPIILHLFDKIIRRKNYS